MDDVATSVAVTADRWLLLIHQLPAGSFLGRPATSSGSPSRMSLVGQKRRLDRRSATSGLPREADIFRVLRHVSKVPCAVVEDRGTSPNEISSTSTPIRVLLGGVFR